jgi:hypothetical protein
MRRTVDLNRPGLTRPLCAPLQRSLDPWAGDPYVNGPPYLPMAVAGRWAVELVPGRPTAEDPPASVKLWRCGHRRPQVVARCHCWDVSIGDGMVAWGGRRANAFDVASGRRRSWRLPRPGHARVAQAGRTLLLWTQRSSEKDPPEPVRGVGLATNTGLVIARHSENPSRSTAPSSARSPSLPILVRYPYYIGT